jgi:hypothetical protein
MLSRARVLILFAILAAALAGCSGEGDTPFTPARTGMDTTPAAVKTTASPPDTINHYVVAFAGRTVTSGQTTFTWRVYGTGVEPALSHFTVEIPECAGTPVAYSPTNSVSINTNPQTGIYGLEWHLSVEPDDAVGRTYTVTYAGDVPVGVIRGAVKTGDETGVGEIPGPCGGFDIAGSVFSDADKDGSRGGTDEPGIANVTVQLLAAGLLVESTVTDLSGSYRFRKLAGTYTVRVGPANGGNDFNGNLAENFEPTGAPSLEVTVGPDALGLDFGYAPLTQDIIFDLETGVLLSNGESVKFWKQQLRAALSNGQGNHVYDGPTLLGFLAAIQQLALPEIYNFTPGQELEEAFAILGSNSHDPLDELLQELLATEFNEVSGRGLLSNPDLQDVLISWGESLILENSTKIDKARTTDSGDITLATDMFGLINTGGGGGVDE